MLVFVIRRLAASVPVLLASTFVINVFIALSGDPLADLKARNPRPSQAVLDARAHALGLDHNFFERYLLWLKGLLTGHLGTSIQNYQLGHEITRRLSVTLRMVIGAMVLALVLAVLAGVISAIKQYSGLDYSLTFVGFLCLSLPAFWFAALLKEFLAIDLNNLFGHRVVDTVGEATPDLSGGWWAHLTDDLSHLALPTLALALISYASWSRFQRASMLDVLSSDYVKLARAKGLPFRTVMVRHALRTALIPLATVVAIDFGAILGGAVITETVFAWHGMGELLLTSVRTRDDNAVLAWLLVSGIAVILFNLVADLLYAVLDPRIRLA